MPYLPKSVRKAQALAARPEVNALIARPLSKTELAIFLDLSERFLELEVQAGRLRAVKLGARALRFLPKDIQNWMDRNATLPAQEVAK
jgi:hypothetical protein